MILSHAKQDFKPANCMLCMDGTIKITDFGTTLLEKDATLT